MPADADASKPEFGDGFIQLLGSHIRMLQGDGSQTCKPVRVRLAPFRKFFVLGLDDPARQFPVCFVPPRALMAEDLDVDPLLIQNLKPLRTKHQWAIHVVRDIRSEFRILDEIQFLRRNKMAVDIDDSDPFPADRYLTPRGREALRNNGSAHRVSGNTDEVPAALHGRLLVRRADGITNLVPLVLLVFLLIPSAAAAQGTAGILGNTGLWKILTADTLPSGKTSFSTWYDRINRNPGNLTISTAGFSAAVGIGRKFEAAAAFEADKQVRTGRQDQLSFGQQALGFFGNQTPGSPPLASELISGSSRMPQLRSPATPGGALTGAAGFYDLLPFAGLVQEGGGIGQLTAGGKWKLLSEATGSPLGLAVHAHLDIPIRKGIDYLLSHPVGTADLQFGFDGILSRNLGDAGVLYWNAGYRHIDQPVHNSVVQLADEVPLGFGWNVPKTGRIQFTGETTAEVFIGGHTPDTTFGAEDPVDLTVGFRFEVIPRMILSAGYRRPVNQYGGDKNGFVFQAAFAQSR